MTTELKTDRSPDVGDEGRHVDAPLKPHDPRLAMPDMTDTQIREWIDACNHEPARRVLRRYLAITSSEFHLAFPAMDLTQNAIPKNTRAERAESKLALRPTPAVSDLWRTMESAPKDATNILACWDAPTPEFRIVGVVFWDDSGGQWLSSPGHWAKEPTHWRPLPDPPGSAVEAAPNTQPDADLWRQAIEAAAKVADARCNRANDCERLGITDPETGVAECAMETRGEDCTCVIEREEAGRIATAIRALTNSEARS